MMALLFVGALAAIGAAWAGRRAAALWLWAADVALILVLFRLHATDALKLDFCEPPMSPDLTRALNILGLFGVGAILAFALADQLLFGDLPCPLCLLQRAGFTAAGVGLVLNLVFGSRPSHYGIVILAALAGALTASRQVLLHIEPGTGAYGPAIAGMHFYTWALIAFLGMILAAAAMLFFERQFERDARPAGRPAGWALAAIALFAAVTLLNAGSTVAECGLGLCPDDPVEYELLPRLLQPAPPR